MIDSWHNFEVRTLRRFTPKWLIDLTRPLCYRWPLVVLMFRKVGRLRKIEKENHVV